MNTTLRISKNLKFATLILATLGGLYGCYEFLLSEWTRSHRDFALATDVLALERNQNEYRVYKLLTDLSDYRALLITETDPEMRARWSEMIDRINKELEYLKRK